MTFKNAINHFNSLLAETSKKSEIKLYKQFIRIITSLEQRNLSAAEIQAMEVELDALELDPAAAKSKKYYKRALNHFRKYLKDTFSLTTKGYYTNIGIGLGLSFGTLVGIILLSDLERSLGISLGTLIGFLIGLIIGRRLDDQAEALGKMV